MKQFKIPNIISIICSIIGLILATLGLIIGLNSIGVEGWGGLGTVFIIPSVISIIVILLDFLITVNKIKRGLIYSWISSLIKIGAIGCFIPSAIYDLKYGVSNLDFNITVIAALTIITIPSILNIIKLIKLKNEK